MRMPAFIWMSLVTSFLLLFAMPIIAVALFQAMMQWLDAGERPTPDSIAALCQVAAPPYDAPCLFDTDYSPTAP